MNGNKLKPKSPNINPFLCQPNLFLDPEGQPNPFNPKSLARKRVDPKKWVRFGRTIAWCVQGWFLRGVGCRVLKLSGRIQTAPPPDLTYVDDVSVIIFFS